MRLAYLFILMVVAFGAVALPHVSLAARPQEKALRPEAPPAKPPAPERTDELKADDNVEPPADQPEKANEETTKKTEALVESTADEKKVPDLNADQDTAPAKAKRSQSENRPARRADKSAKSNAPSAEKQTEQRVGKSTADDPAQREVRLLELSGQYVDLLQPLSLDPSSLLLGTESLKPKSFYNLCEYLDDLAREEDVGHVVFDLSDAVFEMNPAQLDEMTRRLEKLKGSGKLTYAWLENPGNTQLAIAVACNEIVLADFGGVDMPSMSMQSIFYRDAMDLLGVQASVVRAGDFKGAVEPYINPQMSEHLRKHNLEMLAAINDAQVDRIARGRALTVAQVRELQQQRLLLPEQALAKGLVDHLAPYGSMKKTFNELIGEDLKWTKPKAAPKREMSVFELMGRIMSGDKKSADKVKADTIAVLHMSGTIVDGKKATPGSIVSGPAVKTIEELADDDKIKAVVVRINSPGGSATASEAVRRALASLAEKKPTIVSMGEMAASGGYWIACIGQPVYAEKGTITGSIGVFSLKLSLGSLMRRVGLHVESIALDETAQSNNIDRPWSEHDVRYLQAFVDDVYSRFLRLVSKSRGLPLETVQGLAGGRVWSGTQAKSNKLIDEIGGLDDCIAAVAKKAKLEDFELIHRPVVKSGFDLLELLGEEDPSEIELQTFFKSHVMQAVSRQGFDLSVTKLLLRSGLMQQGSGLPQVWGALPERTLNPLILLQSFFRSPPFDLVRLSKISEHAESKMHRRGSE